MVRKYSWDLMLRGDSMKLGKQEYLCIKDPATGLHVAHETYECCGGQLGENRVPCHRPIQRGDLYVEHHGSLYHPECAIQVGLVERAPMRQCPRCHRFILPGQSHTECPAVAAAAGDYNRG